MGMTDNQFKAFRQMEMDNYVRMLGMAREECEPGSKLIKALETEIDRCKADVER